MRKITWMDQARYRFDNLMSRGTVALILWLFLVSMMMIVCVSLFVNLARIGPVEGDPLEFGEAVWLSLMRTLDPGTMGGDEGWAFRISMLIITLGGIFIVSSLIGILTTGLEAKLEDMRKGRSFVVERDHTVVLGWTPKIFTIVSELVIANQNKPKSCIAILADKEKVEMEDEIRDKAIPTGRTRVVCRTGNPIDTTDLEIVNPHEARAIIVLSPEMGEADSQTIKTILALTNQPDRRQKPYHILAEIRDPKNMEVAQLVGRDETRLLLVDNLIGRITAQTCRQSGLSVVYTDLLDFGGDEIYFHEEPLLIGKSFTQACMSYEKSSLIGIKEKDGRIQINPPKDFVVQAGDQVIAISEDDDTIRLSDLRDDLVDSSAQRASEERDPLPERTLILGWNRRAPIIINELDYYVAPGSEATIVSEDPIARDICSEQCRQLKNQQLDFLTGDTCNRQLLEGLNIPLYDHIITLGNSDQLDYQEADARTLVTLLHIRDIAERSKRSFSIVSEMMDSRNRELAEVARADDFIVSDKLISLLMAQISENRDLSRVFEDLLDAEGSEIYLKPVDQYVEPEKAVSFYTVVASALRQDAVAIGYRQATFAEKPAQSYGVVLNPLKSDLITFDKRDKIILLAEK